MTTTPGADELSPLKRAIVELREMRSRLDDVERARTEPIAIVGMGCRFPGGGDDPESFWRLLHDGVDAVSEVPPSRWDIDAYYDPDPDAPGKMYTRHGSFLKDIDRFDPRFFNISPREAHNMDPQQRLLLEVAWEALENAGQAADKLLDSETGVFVGISTNDYANKGVDTATLDAYFGSGNSMSAAAGRLSYVLGLQGPSVSLDTACSSSLVALHLACQSLRSRECRLALVAGVNVVLNPYAHVLFCKARMLAPDGRCKSFAAAADGYVRGEGCGVVVLKRLGDAVAGRDRILAVIRGTAVNQGGRSGGLTVPNGLALENVMRRAVAASGIEPAQVSYVEAHGTGTSLGDPIEMRALGSAFGGGRATDRPLVVGSVKTNVGHLESASGVAALIKVVLALQHGEIPPHLHFLKPSPHIPWSELPVTIPTELMPWPAAYDRRIAGISAFGFTGTNAHIIVEAAPDQVAARAEAERPLHLLALSARSDEALVSVAQRMAEHLAAEPAASLADVAWSANTGRSHFGHRLAVVAESAAQARERLEAVVAGGTEVAGVTRGRVHGSERPEVAFLFTGQGSQHAGMGRQLYETQPTFRRVIDRCDELLRPLMPRPLRSVLYPEAGEATPIDETQYAQPALFALEYALSELWRSWGIEPAAVLGHGVGEYVAACVAGVFSWEDALRLVAARGRLMQSLPAGGEMAAVSADESRVRAAIAAHGAGVAVAALNGPHDTVISGPGASVRAMCAAFAAEGVRCEPLAVSHAFHSILTDPVLDAFEAEAARVAYAPPRLHLVSDLTGRIAGDEVASAGYWRRHLREPVRFAAGMATLHELGAKVFVEIGPRPALLALGQRCVPEASAAWLPSLREGRDDGSQILESLSSLHVRGVDVDWEGFDRDGPRRKVALPTYPFQRERFWMEHQQPRSAEKAPARADLRKLVYEDEASAEERSALRQQLAEASPSRRHELLVAYLRGHIARVIGLSTPDLVETDRPLSESGLDSLMATHLKNRLEADLEADVPVGTFLAGASVAEVARLVDEARGARTELTLLRPAPRDAELPLSFAQQRLWFLDRVGAGSAYHLSWALRLTGPLDVSALEASLGEVVRRHEALRTVFHEVDGRLVQVVRPASPRPLISVDLGATAGEGEQDRARVARQWAEEEAARPFDLSQGPLLRATLLRLGEDDHALALTVHHIAADGWSVEVLVRELAVLYEAFIGGAPSPLAELPIQYADFARWQREWLQGHVLDEQLSYWRRLLGDGPPVFEIPTDRPRPTVQTFRGATRSIAFPRALADEIRALSQREGVTLFMTLLAALQTLFHRYTGQDDMVVGSSIANRNRAEIEGLIGFFVNTLVLRTDLSGNPPFRELLARVKGVALGAYDHQDLPFEKLVEELHPDRDLARNPFFQVILDVQNAARKELRLRSLTLTPIETEVKVARFDLEIHLWESPELLAAEFNYNTDLFEAATIERMLGHFQALLEGIVARPGARLTELPYLTPGERQLTLVDWNRTGRDYPREAGIHELFEVQATRRPEAIAVSFGGEELSYGELNARASRLAHHLMRHGVGHEVRVGICMERSVEMVVGLLGILKAGGAYVPLDPSYPKERLAFMLEDSRVPVLLTQERMLEALPQHGARVVCLDRDWETIAAESDANPKSGAGGQSLAYVIYTSGSTGIPKGAAIPHCAVNRLVVNTDYVQVQPSDRIAQASNSSFDAATFEIWGALLNGARIVGMSREVTLSPRDLAAELRRSEVTILFLTTALFNQVAREEVGAFSSLRHLLFGGEAVDPACVRDVLRHGSPERLLHVYGPTETTTYATWQLVAEVAEGASTVPIGRPIANTTTYVLDRGLDPVPVGIPGELFLGGDGLARGYLERPDLTAEKFVPDPFSAEGGGRLYRTGDLVRYRPDGAIEFLGRVDHQVKLRGYRIELGEIESVLGQHPGVKDAIVIAREDRPGDKRLVAYVTSRDGHGLEAGQLRDHLQARLPEHMVPSAYVALERLPLSPNGKVDRRALPAPEGPSRPDQALVPPRNDLEREIAAIWREVLGVDEVGVNENFFDLGGHSLTLLQVHGKLRRGVTHRDVKVVDLFEYPTISALATHLSRAEPMASDTPRRAHRASQTEVRDEGIAIIGMAGRFPGAPDLDQFWRNLQGGVESISFFSAEELEAEGIPAALYREARYVKARGVIEGADLFDAAFFGYNPREAEILDPQQRVFLETAWTALETAGYDPSRYRGKIGVYAGTSLNTYAFNLISNPEVVRSVGGLAALIASDKDFLTTRVSYKLNLRGPSVAVQTACSTSLVAVHLACRSLIDRECDIGLAGGVSVGVPQRAGYLYQEEGIYSPDGHCRAFDRGARGTVGGSGVGIVVLKRLGDALADGDAIEAVIKGSAINNDGAAKVGYTAPGVEGQAEVIAMAQAAAGMEPETIGYVEAHGTGTALGDPIEIQALTQVFGSAGNGRTPCLIGSLKTNVGHLDAAAGVAGLIKTALALKHRQIPPSLHFEEPNPKIDFANGPFRVSTRLSEWPPQETPRRAAVSSFGIGGTNAHVVLEEAPPPPPADLARRPCEALVLSARTEAALEQATRNLAAHLETHPDLPLADAAYTLQVGRREFRHRRMVVCRDVTDAVRALEGKEPGRLLDRQVDRTGRGVAFLFPGQGAQHTNMGLGLYRTEEVFTSEVDRCVEILRPDLGFDLLDVLYPSEAKEAEASRRLEETAVAQPALFVVEYAMACLWMSWGVKPESMLGHSVGEYVAACLAGVFSLDDALSLVAARGRLMQEMPKGSMLAVLLPEQEVLSLLDGSVGLAATNAPSQCVVSGSSEAVEALEGRLSARGVDSHRLRTSHAFHSPMMEPVLSAFRQRVAAVKRHAPRVRYVSNVTGTWATDAQAVDPGYWARHLRETVRFSQGLGELLEEGSVLLEVGPGQSLSALARQHPERGPDEVAVASARHPRESRPDEEVLLGALGRLWLAGVDVDWDAFHAGERRRRVALPTYPFERERYWVDPRPDAQPIGSPSPAPAGKKGDIADWFYRPTWSSSRPMQEPQEPRDPRDDGAVWMVFVDECGLGRNFVQRLDRAGCRVISVAAGDRFERRGAGEYAIRPAEAADYDALFRELREEGALPDRIVHAWGVTRRSEPAAPIERTQDLGFYSLVFLAQALGNGDLPGEVGITVVTSGMQGVSGEGLASADKATVLGPCRVIPQEYAALSCRSVDIVVPESGVWRDDEIERLLAECGDLSGEPVIAYRGGERWVQTFESFRLEGRGRGVRLRERGVYLITGGLGGIGIELATFLAEAVRARLVLVGRTGLPPREEWAALLDRDGEADATSRRIRRLQAIEAHGGEVLVLQADVSDRRQMEEALAGAEARFGRIHGVIHAAGVAPGGVIQLKTREMAERVLAPKVRGTLVLGALLEDRQPDFVVLCSSLASVLGVPGQADYCAANAFQDAFARRSADAGGPFVLSLNWDTWTETGMAAEGDAPRGIRAGEEAGRASGDGILSAEGAEVFARALGQPLPQLLVSTVDLAPRLALFRALNETLPVAGPREPRPRHRRPELATAYVAPQDEVEQVVADLWQELLGFELVGVHDNFFDLGGHSLLAMQMTNWLRQTFQVPVKLQTLFDGPTVADVARVLVENEPVPGQAREIARLALSVEGLSNAEVERMLEEPKASGGYIR